MYFGYSGFVWVWSNQKFKNRQVTDSLAFRGCRFFVWNLFCIASATNFFWMRRATALDLRTFLICYFSVKPLIFRLGIKKCYCIKLRITSNRILFHSRRTSPLSREFNAPLLESFISQWMQSGCIPICIVFLIFFLFCVHTEETCLRCAFSLYPSLSQPSYRTVLCLHVFTLLCSDIQYIEWMEHQCNPHVGSVLSAGRPHSNPIIHPFSYWKTSTTILHLRIPHTRYTHTTYPHYCRTSARESTWQLAVAHCTQYDVCCRWLQSTYWCVCVWCVCLLVQCREHVCWTWWKGSNNRQHRLGPYLQSRALYPVGLAIRMETINTLTPHFFYFVPCMCCASHPNHVNTPTKNRKKLLSGVIVYIYTMMLGKVSGNFRARVTV